MAALELSIISHEVHQQMEFGDVVQLLNGPGGEIFLSTAVSKVKDEL